MIVENECLFWPRVCLVFALNSPRVLLGFALTSLCRSIFMMVDFSAECEPNALCCRRQHPESKEKAPRLRQDSWGRGTTKMRLAHFCWIRAKTTTDCFGYLGKQNECEANARRNAKILDPNRNLTFFFESSRVRVTNSCMCDRGFSLCLTTTENGSIPLLESLGTDLYSFWRYLTGLTRTSSNIKA